MLLSSNVMLFTNSDCKPLALKINYLISGSHNPLTGLLNWDMKLKFALKKDSNLTY